MCIAGTQELQGAFTEAVKGQQKSRMKGGSQGQVVTAYVVGHMLKGTVRPRTGHESPDGKQRYSSTLSLTSVLGVGGWLTPRLDRLNPQKLILYPSYTRLGGPQGQSGRVRKISSSQGFDPRAVQPLASRYNYYAIWPTKCGWRRMVS